MTTQVVAGYSKHLGVLGLRMWCGDQGCSIRVIVSIGEHRGRPLVQGMQDLESVP
jgi:hypothetical protein